MPSDTDSDTVSAVTYAGLGGAVVCCAALELLGGVAIVSGLATAIGLSTGLTYLAVVGATGLVVAAAVIVYRRSHTTHV